MAYCIDHFDSRLSRCFNPTPKGLADSEHKVMEGGGSTMETQKLQYPLIKEYTLNLIMDPTII